MEVVSFAAQDVVELHPERWSGEQREIAKTLRTLPRRLMGGVVGRQREDCTRSEQCDASNRGGGGMQTARAHALVQVGELSAGRVALEAAE